MEHFIELIRSSMQGVGHAVAAVPFLFPLTIATGSNITAADVLGMVSFQVDTTGTMSLTTVANEKVLVIAKATQNTATSTATVLAYNGVTKDSVTSNNGGGGKIPVMCMYTEVPGAATHNVTLTGGSLTDIVIIAVHLKQS